MATPFHNSVKTFTFHDEDWQFTMNLASAIVVDDVGKVLSADTTPNTAKLAAADAPVIGVLDSFEDRGTGKVGAVALKGIFKVAKTGSLNVGDSVVGAGSGAVKAAPIVTPTTATPFTAAQMAALAALSRTRVLEVDNTANTAVVAFL